MFIRDTNQVNAGGNSFNKYDQADDGFPKRKLFIPNRRILFSNKNL